MSEDVRYWLLAAVTWIATRWVTGSALVAMVATTVTCLVMAREMRLNKINLMSSQNSAPGSDES